MFCLVLFGSLGIPIDRKVLRAQRTVLGREECDILIINDLAVSGQHAELLYRDDLSLTLSDLGSTNGTFFRVRPGKLIKLWDGCKIIVGRQLLTFSAAAQLATPAGPPRARTMALSTIPKEQTHGRFSFAVVTSGETRDFPLTKRAVLGRAKEKADLAFEDDDYLSPAHAIIEFNVKLQQVVISDLQSMNGVFVQLRTPVVLEDGDMFRIGEQLFGVVSS